MKYILARRSYDLTPDFFLAYAEFESVLEFFRLRESREQTFYTYFATRNDDATLMMQSF